MLKEVSLERIIVLLLLCATIFLFPYILWWIDHKVFRVKIWKFLENPKLKRLLDVSLNKDGSLNFNPRYDSYETYIKKIKEYL